MIWLLATLMLIMSAFLFGLCAVIFAYYASKKHKYLLHIALMSSSYLMFSGLVTVQLITRMFSTRLPFWLPTTVIFLGLALGIGGLARMWKHRKNEEMLKA
jgi:hypothetical protein